MKKGWVFPFDKGRLSKVLILTEGGKGIGYGHITRNLGLIHYLKEFGIEPILMVRGSDINNLFLEGEKYILNDWLQEDIFDLIDKDALVFVDSYFADLNFYRRISDKSEKLIIYDDYGRLKYDVGYILNPVVEHDFYSGYNKVLMGEDYIFLRKAFWYIKEKRGTNDKKNILITLGGNPPKDLIKYIVNKIDSDKKITIISEPIDGVNAEFTGYCNSYRLAEVMQKADLAISAGGQTLHELYKLGIETYVLKISENQKYVIEFYIKKGFKKFEEF
ncbi:MAG: hypothetical protein K6348_08710 [Deferribacterales bacterium]